MCDTMGALVAGGALFAKNSDRPVAEAQVFERYGRRAGGGELQAQYVCIPDRGAFALVGSRPTWLWGMEHGVNEHRVAIGNEKVWTAEDPREVADALIGMDLVRLGLELGRTAGAAIGAMTELLERYGQGGVCDETFGDRYFSSFLVVDPAEVWVLETSGRRWNAQRMAPPARGAAISNRIALRDEWRHPTAPTAHADRRLEVTHEAVCASDPSPASLAAALRDHGARPGELSPIPAPEYGPDGSGVTVCMHVRGYQATAGSMIASLPADPAEPIRLWVALGAPCASVYVPVAGIDDVPSLLGDAEVWGRFDRLRQRAESDPDALTAIRSVLDPIERELWDGVDQRGAAARITSGLQQLRV